MALVPWALGDIMDSSPMTQGGANCFLGKKESRTDMGRAVVVEVEGRWGSLGVKAWVVGREARRRRALVYRAMVIDYFIITGTGAV